MVTLEKRGEVKIRHGEGEGVPLVVLVCRMCV